jgi:hypothetical protein
VVDGWRECPFVIGDEYRTRKAFRSLRDKFRVGEVLRFVSTAYSRYDGMTGYFFLDSAGRTRAWDIPDDEDLEQHRELFERLVR